ncbi:hypothetical protein [Apilactobacillus zhangqiuensis]|uniref:hypothetical protein n=1 Tax=Apilactobacillus zhangqiuensis TaxID=2841031 RepID=UPI001C7D96D8|nr:hypothetical protein [Apilactobacillus zhangqiuensis]
MATSMLYMYSEFNSVDQLPEPGYVKIIWWMGIAIFIVLQATLLLLNINNRLKMSCLIILSGLFLLDMIGFKSINLQIICLSFLIMNSESISFKKFIKVDFITRIVCIATILIMFFGGIFPSQYDVYVPRGDTIRSSLGFNHPNSFGGYCLYILISFLLFFYSTGRLKRLNKLINLFWFLVMFIAGFFIEFVYADSRSSQVAFIIIALLIIPLVFNKNIKSFKPLLGIFTLLIVTLTSIMIVFFYNEFSTFFVKLNDLTSNRLFLQNEAFRMFGFSFFNVSDFAQGNPIWVDNQYVYDLISTGIIGSLIYTYIYAKSFINTHKANCYILYIILIALIFKGSFESTLIDYYALLPIICSFFMVNKISMKQ